MDILVCKHVLYFDRLLIAWRCFTHCGMRHGVSVPQAIQVRNIQISNHGFSHIIATYFQSVLETTVRDVTGAQYIRH